MVVRSVEAGRLELNLAKRSGVAALTDLYLPSDNRHAPCPALSSHRGWKERSPFIGSREKPKPELDTPNRAATQLFPHNHCHERFILEGHSSRYDRRCSSRERELWHFEFIPLRTGFGAAGQSWLQMRIFRAQLERQARKKPRRNAGLPGAEGGTRTHTLLRAADFESAASTVPPLRRGRGV